MRAETITSAQNAKIKLLLELQEKSKTRKKEGLFVVEGRRELLHCIEAGYVPHTVFFCPDIINEEDRTEIEQAIERQNAEGGGRMPAAIEVPQQLYDKVAYRGGTEGVVAEMPCKDLSLDSLKLHNDPHRFDDFRRKRVRRNSLIDRTISKLPACHDVQAVCLSC